jgi:hypothetical protein
MKAPSAAKFTLPAILFLAAALFAGCATTKSVDWNSRVGNYTYDQAVTEFGMPDRQSRLSDGKVVSKWFSQPQTNPNLNTGMSFYGSTGFGTGHTPGPSHGTRFLQLTFGTNGVLADWSKNY